MTELLSGPSRPRVEIRRPQPLDLVVVAAGALAVAFSFVSYYTVTIQTVSSRTSAWHGFWGWFGAVLAAVAAALVTLAWCAPALSSRRAAGAVLVLFLAATVSTLLALFQDGFDTARPRAYAMYVHSGHGYGYWISLASVILGATASLVRLRQVGASGR